MVELPESSVEQSVSLAKLVLRTVDIGTGTTYDLFASVIIGRSRAGASPVDVDLSTLPRSEHISPRHARIWSSADGKWWIEDLGSHAGTFRRSAGDSAFQKVTTRQRILNGDELSFGNIRFIFQPIAQRPAPVKAKYRLPASHMQGPTAAGAVEARAQSGSVQSGERGTRLHPAVLAAIISAAALVLVIAAAAIWYFHSAATNRGASEGTASEAATEPANGSTQQAETAGDDVQATYTGLSYPGVYLAEPSGQPLKTAAYEDWRDAEEVWVSLRHNAGLVSDSPFRCFVYPASTCASYGKGSLIIYQVDPPAVLGNYPRAEYIGNVTSDEYTVAEFEITLPVKGFYAICDPSRSTPEITYDCLIEWR